MRYWETVTYCKGLSSHHVLSHGLISCVPDTSPQAADGSVSRDNCSPTQKAPC